MALGEGDLNINFNIGLGFDAAQARRKGEELGADFDKGLGAALGKSAGGRVAGEQFGEDYVKGILKILKAGRLGQAQKATQDALAAASEAATIKEQRRLERADKTRKTNLNARIAADREATRELSRIADRDARSQLATDRRNNSLIVEGDKQKKRLVIRDRLDLLQSQRHADSQQLSQQKQEERLEFVASKAHHTRMTEINRVFFRALGQTYHTGLTLLTDTYRAGVRGLQRAWGAGLDLVSRTWESHLRKQESLVRGAGSAETRIIRSNMSTQDTAVRLGLDRQNAAYTAAARKQLGIIERNSTRETQVIKASAVKQAAAVQEGQRLTSTGIIGAATGRSALGGALLGLTAGIGGTMIFRTIIDQAIAAQKATRDTNAVLLSTHGAANVTAEEIHRYAAQLALLSGVDRDVIHSHLNMLLTFPLIRNEVGKGNDIFNQAGLAALNLSVRMKGDLTGAIKQVGKALQDPNRGLTALRRSGVQFSDSQTALIKKLASTGHLLEAQKVILAELNKEFAGAAAAQATAGEKLKVTASIIAASIGGAILPAINAFVGAFTAFVVALATGQGVWKIVRDGLVGIAVGMTAVLVAKGAVEVIKLLGVAIGFLSAQPLIAVGLALAALTGILVGFARSSTAVQRFFRELTTGAKEWVAAGFNLKKPIDNLGVLASVLSHVGYWARVVVDFAKGFRNWIEVGYLIKQPIVGLSLLTRILTTIGYYTRVIVDFAKGFQAWIRIGYIIQQPITGLSKLTAVLTTIGSTAHLFVNSLGQIATALKDLFTGKWKEGNRILGDVWDQLFASIRPAVTTIRTALGSAFESIRSAVAEFFRTLWSGPTRSPRGELSKRLGEAVTGIDKGTLASQLGTKLHDILVGAFQSVTGLVGSLLGGLFTGEAGIKPDAARRIGVAIHKLITDAFNTVRGFVGSLLGGLFTGDVKFGTDPVRNLGAAIHDLIVASLRVVGINISDFFANLFGRGQADLKLPATNTIGEKVGQWIHDQVATVGVGKLIVTGILSAIAFAVAGPVAGIATLIGGTLIAKMFSSGGGGASSDAKTKQTLGDRVKGILGGIGAAIGGFFTTQVGPAILKGLYSLGKFLGGPVLSTVFSEPVLKAIAVATAALAAAAGAFLAGFLRGLLTSIPKILTALRHVGDMFLGALLSGVAGNAFIAPLVSALKSLFDAVFRDAAFIVSAVGNLWDMIFGTDAQQAKAFSDFKHNLLQGLATTIHAVFLELIPDVIKAVGGLFQVIGDSILNWAKGLGGPFNSVFLVVKAALIGIAEAISTIGRAVRGLTPIFATIGGVIVAGLAVSKIMSAIESIKTGFGKMQTKINEHVVKIGDSLAKVTMGAIQVGGAISRGLGVLAPVGTAAREALSKVGPALDTLGGKFKAMGDRIKGTALVDAPGIKSKFESAIGGAMSAVGTGIQKFVQTSSKLWGQVKAVGASAIGGIQKAWQAGTGAIGRVIASFRQTSTTGLTGEDLANATKRNMAVVERQANVLKGVMAATATAISGYFATMSHDATQQVIGVMSTAGEVAAAFLVDPIIGAIAAIGAVIGFVLGKIHRANADAQAAAEAAKASADQISAAFAAAFKDQGFATFVDRRRAALEAMGTLIEQNNGQALDFFGSLGGEVTTFATAVGKGKDALRLYANQLKEMKLQNIFGGAGQQDLADYGKAATDKVFKPMLTAFHNIRDQFRTGLAVTPLDTQVSALFEKFRTGTIGIDALGVKLKGLGFSSFFVDTQMAALKGGIAQLVASTSGMHFPDQVITATENEIKKAALLQQIQLDTMSNADKTAAAYDAVRTSVDKVTTAVKNLWDAQHGKQLSQTEALLNAKDAADQIAAINAKANAPRFIQQESFDAAGNKITKLIQNPDWIPRGQAMLEIQRISLNQQRDLLDVTSQFAAQSGSNFGKYKSQVDTLRGSIEELLRSAGMGPGQAHQIALQIVPTISLGDFKGQVEKAAHEANVDLINSLRATAKSHPLTFEQRVSLRAAERQLRQWKKDHAKDTLPVTTDLKPDPNEKAKHDGLTNRLGKTIPLPTKVMWDINANRDRAALGRHLGERIDIPTAVIPPPKLNDTRSRIVHALNGLISVPSRVTLPWDLAQKRAQLRKSLGEPIIVTVGIQLDPLSVAVANAQIRAGVQGTGLGAGHGHAQGAIVRKKHLALIAEDGAEAVIPLTKPARAAQLLKESGLLSQPAVQAIIREAPKASPLVVRAPGATTIARVAAVLPRPLHPTPKTPATSIDQALQVLHKLALADPAVNTFLHAMKAAGSAARVKFRFLLRQGTFDTQPRLPEKVPTDEAHRLDMLALIAHMLKGLSLRNWLAGLSPADRKFAATEVPKGTVPQAAAGMIVRSRKLVMVGEDGPEVIVPLTKPQRAAQLIRESGLREVVRNIPTVVSRPIASAVTGKPPKQPSDTQRKQISHVSLLATIAHTLKGFDLRDWFASLSPVDRKVAEKQIPVGAMPTTSTVNQALTVLHKMALEDTAVAKFLAAMRAAGPAARVKFRGQLVAHAFDKTPPKLPAAQKFPAGLQKHLDMLSLIAHALKGLALSDWLKNLSVPDRTYAVKQVPTATVPKAAIGRIIRKRELLVAGEAGPELLLPLDQPRRAMELLAQSGLFDKAQAKLPDLGPGPFAVPTSVDLTAPPVTPAKDTGPQNWDINAKLDRLALAIENDRNGKLFDTLSITETASPRQTAVETVTSLKAHRFLHGARR